MLVEIEQPTAEGVDLPDTYEGKKDRGTVRALGETHTFTMNGNIDRPFPAEVGDRVLLSEYAVYPYFENGVEYRVISAEDVIGILPPTPTANKDDQQQQRTETKF